ncbi:MAG: hypothetical protein JSR66_03355 [Proteobacteria bacterium]|nr:hypothetical protein [Pseudomonadota bacterium]
MSRRDSYWFIAGALVASAILAGTHAWLPPTPPVHHATMSPQPSATAGSMDDVTNKLAARLATEGGSDNDWRLLAESYDYLGRKADADAARAHIASASPKAAGQATGEEIADIADALDKPHAQGSSGATGNARAN